MKKSRYFIFTFLFSISLFSCSHQKDGGEETSDLYTIKSLVSQIENEAVWSVELEKERLTKTVKQEADFIPEGHTLTTENAKLSASITLTEAGTMIFFSDLQRKKARSGIFFNPSEIFISFRLLQCSKHLLPISLKAADKSMDSSD